MENFDTSELIERFLDNSLSPDERKSVEARIASDDDFRAQVDLHRQLQEEFADPQKLQLRDMMSDIVRDIPAPPEATQPNWLKLLGIALVVLLGVWAIWRLVLPMQESTPKPPAQQEGQAPSNGPSNPVDSLSKPPTQTPSEPIAMADRAAFKPNSIFEARLGNGGIRSSASKVVEMKSPALGADFSAANGKITIQFKGTALADDDEQEFPLQLNIYNNKSSDKPFTQVAPTITNRSEKTENWAFSSKQMLRLPPGLYYFTLERKSDAELLFVGKFSVDKKLSEGK